MASKHSMILVDWYGLFKKDKAFKVSGRFKKALYVLIGKEKHERGKPRLKYIGISETNLRRRLFRNHEKLKKLQEGYEIWIGEVGSYHLPKWKGLSADRAVSLAEWLHVSFTRKSSSDAAFVLNKHKKNIPRDSATVVNHWWERDFESQEQDEPYREFRRSPHPWWPYVIDYFGSGWKSVDHEARVTWMDASWDLVQLSRRHI